MATSLWSLAPERPPPPYDPTMIFGSHFKVVDCPFTVMRASTVTSYAPLFFSV
jgi:hypothetical protein